MVNFIIIRNPSLYWANKGVRPNSLPSGGVFTFQNQEFINKTKKLILLGRMAIKNEYRKVVQFLCFDASKYMNGQNIVIYGGRSVW